MFLLELIWPKMNCNKEFDRFRSLPIFAKVIKNPKRRCLGIFEEARGEEKVRAHFLAMKKISQVPYFRKNELKRSGRELTIVIKHHIRKFYLLMPSCFGARCRIR